MCIIESYIKKKIMREIKFRGKARKGGEWFYGDLFQKDTSGRTHICTTKKGCLDIDPTTVGQFTGLYDRHGEEIYEGDILTYGYDNVINPTPLVVEYKHGAFGYVYIEGNFYSFAGISSFTFNPFDEDDRFEVIGNIYDNPELFKGM